MEIVTEAQLLKKTLNTESILPRINKVMKTIEVNGKATMNGKELSLGIKSDLTETLN